MSQGNQLNTLNRLERKLIYIILFIYISIMIIPVKCFTCGKVLANKYRYYEREVRKTNMANGGNTDEVVYLTEENKDKTPSGEVLDMLKLNKICCRRHILTHVDIE